MTTNPSMLHNKEQHCIRIYFKDKNLTGTNQIRPGCWINLGSCAYRWCQVLWLSIRYWLIVILETLRQQEEALKRGVLNEEQRFKLRNLELFICEHMTNCWCCWNILSIKGWLEWFCPLTIKVPVDFGSHWNQDQAASAVTVSHMTKFLFSRMTTEIYSWYNYYIVLLINSRVRLYPSTLLIMYIHAT